MSPEQKEKENKPKRAFFIWFAVTMVFVIMITLVGTPVAQASSVQNICNFQLNSLGRSWCEPSLIEHDDDDNAWRLKNESHHKGTMVLYGLEPTSLELFYDYVNQDQNRKASMDLGEREEKLISITEQINAIDVVVSEGYVLIGAKDLNYTETESNFEVYKKYFDDISEMYYDFIKN
ncbi:hypothetical protein [Moorena sp. SIO2C4]|uniref:hypothetical protein n=1 Tax=Moorena sp. SIO2C4 TaxID=2607824 RepID=UPI0013CC4867|nr:hypothetical protein [Moorena sp. SIO2C4]NES42145.1 hypothetical protein [Moorena sp. SIO2C4]